LASALLAVALSLCDGLDGREPSRFHADRRVRLCSTDGGYRLLYSGTRHHRQGRSRLASRVSRWQGLERETFTGALPHSYSARFRELMDRQWAVRVRRVPLVDSRPTDRATVGEALRLIRRTGTRMRNSKAKRSFADTLGQFTPVIGALTLL